MSETDWAFIGAAAALTIIATLLSAGESAFAAIGKARAAEEFADNSRTSARVRDIVADKGPYINSATLLRGMCQVGTTLSLAAGTFHLFEHTWQRLLVPGVSVLLIWYLLWGVGAQTLGRQKAHSVAAHSAGVFSVIATVLGPLASVLVIIGNALTPGRGYDDGPFASEAELREMVDMAEESSLIEHEEREMIHSVFEFGDTLAKEVMVPRTSVVFIEQDRTLRQGISLALRSGFSRIPVIGEDLDDVVGVLYIKDLVGRVFENPDAEQRDNVASLMRPPVFTPDSKPVDELMHDMQASRNHMLIVVEEFGGTAGLITMEDIVEEIVGEITDEFDAEPVVAVPLDDGLAFRVSTLLPLDELGDLFELALDDDDVETVGGLLAKELGTVPVGGSQVTWEGLEITADPGLGRRHQVETVVVRRAVQEEDEDNDE
jgi:CBS domain containing-hemolysin-like protein